MILTQIYTNYTYIWPCFYVPTPKNSHNGSEIRIFWYFEIRDFCDISQTVLITFLDRLEHFGAQSDVKIVPIEPFLPAKNPPQILRVLYLIYLRKYASVWKTTLIFRFLAKFLIDWHALYWNLIKTLKVICIYFLDYHRNHAQTDHLWRGNNIKPCPIQHIWGSFIRLLIFKSYKHDFDTNLH